MKNNKNIRNIKEIKERLGLKGIPPIFDICRCSKHCNTIVWGGKEFVQNHHSFGKAPFRKG